MRRWSGEIVAAVERGLALPESQLPRFERTPRASRDLDFEARLERLKTARGKHAAQMALPTGILCPNGTLEAIARATPANPAELAAVPGVRQWQVATIGEAILAAL